jgi:hypothetical protein
VCTALDQCHVAGTCDPTSGVCSNPNATEFTACNDGDACTRTDVCHSGVCTGSNPVVCTALDTCHGVGTCDTATGVCSNPIDPDGTTCNDGNGCTQTDTCQAGVCTGSNPVVCTPVDQCHVVGTCDPASGVCSNPDAADGTACSTGACTLGTACHAGACTGGTACASGLCGTNLTAFAGSETPGWNLNGSATYDTTAQVVALTQAGHMESAGTVVYKDAVVVDDATVAFDFRADTTSGRADGLAFFMQTDGATAVGTNGDGMGITGLHGYGVELDIYNNGSCGDADNNHAGIDSLTSCGAQPTPIETSPNLNDGSAPDHGIGDIGDGQWRTVVVTLSAGVMSVSVTDPTSGMPIAVPNLQSVALPGYVAGTAYYLGFAAGTGGLAAQQEIRNVQITFPSTVCL